MNEKPYSPFSRMLPPCIGNNWPNMSHTTRRILYLIWSFFFYFAKFTRW